MSDDEKTELMTETLSVMITPTMMAALDAAAWRRSSAETRTTRAEIVREALLLYLAQEAING